MRFCVILALDYTRGVTRMGHQLSGYGPSSLSMGIYIGMARLYLTVYLVWEEYIYIYGIFFRISETLKVETASSVTYADLTSPLTANRPT